MEIDHEKKVLNVLRALAVSQAAAAANMAITFVAGSILLVQMSGGRQNLAGLPTALILLTSSLAAVVIGRIKDARGYRFTLNTGYAFGIAAGVLAFSAAHFGSLGMLIAAMLLVGLAMGSIMLCRFAAAEIRAPQQRGKAISFVMTGATVGAVSGPFLVNFAHTLGAGISMGGPETAFAIMTLLYLLGLGASLVLIRIEPRTLAWKAPQSGPAGAGVSAALAAPQGLIPDRAFALGSLFFGQVAMVFLMAVTPVHMHHHNHGMGEISLVITVHFLGMYGSSFFSGWVADKFGRAAAIAAGSAALLASCLIGISSESYAGILATLFLLGMGWNFCFLSGTALVADSLKTVANKGRVQGAADAFVNIGSAGASLSAGFFLEKIGFRGMAMLGCLLSVLPMILLMLWKIPRAAALPREPADQGGTTAPVLHGVEKGVK
jgi:MFS family permease